MQEEVEQKTFNIVVSTTKLTARTILNAGKAAIQQQQAKMAGGKQSVRMLLRQNRGVSSVEIDKTNIRGFERYAKKYGIDYAIRKDNSEMPPRYLVFFKAPDAEAFNSAFKEYSASLLNKDKRPSVLARLH
jgi:chemotaxis receptor (MCP) glutamine deamidase CheD